MKCAECGLPLSPSRTNCPRCGAPAGKASGKIRLTRDTAAPTPPHVNLPAGIDTLDRTPPVWPTLTPPVLPPNDPATEQEAFPEADSGFPLSTAAFAPSQHATDAAPAQNQPYGSNMPPAPAPYVPTTPPAAPERYQTPTPHSKPTVTPDRGSVTRQPKTRLGFTVAAMCFTAGIIIMIFVFIMAQSLAPNNQQSSTAAASKPQTANVQTTPIPPTPTSLQATPTVTPTLTGSQYINNVNLASSVDTTTGQPLQTTTEFHSTQSIYVTMSIQQAAYSGFVCLDWSVNNQPYPYASPAAPTGANYLTQSNAYFYYHPGVVGNGSVKVSWASTNACTDKVLIQTLTFTVIP